MNSGRIKRENLFQMCFAVTRVTSDSYEIWSTQKHQCKGFSHL